MKIETRTEFNTSDKHKIDYFLKEYNENKTKGFFGEELVPLQITAYEDNEVIGGIEGFSYLGTLDIKTVVMKENFRGKGLGTKLMEALEKEGRKRNCKRIVLDTFSFQAPGFYEKLGYSEFGKYSHSDSEIERFYYIKEL